MTGLVRPLSFDSGFSARFCRILGSWIHFCSVRFLLLRSCCTVSAAPVECLERAQLALPLPSPRLLLLLRRWHIMATTHHGDGISCDGTESRRRNMATAHRGDGTSRRRHNMATVHQGDGTMDARKKNILLFFFMSLAMSGPGSFLLGPGSFFRTKTSSGSKIQAEAAPDRP